MVLILTLVLGPETSARAATDAERFAFIASCQRVGNLVVRHHFRYSNSGVKGSLPKAIATRRRTNCATFASWCMQEGGLIARGKTFYVGPGGGIRKSFGSWGGKVNVIRVFKKPAKVNLQIGDVVCWKGAHVCIYAGRSAKGNRLWIDGGKVATKANRNGSLYKKAGKLRSLGYLNSRVISYIIRMK